MIYPISYQDFYKTDHRRQYPEGTELVYSNFTARGSRLDGVDHVVVFGIQYFIMRYLIGEFRDSFFNVDRDKAVHEYKRILDNSLGKDSVSIHHIEDLHKLGYLPIRIKALPEGTKCPIKTPVLTIVNTLPEFYWLVNFLETLLSTTLWGPMTSATIANRYKEILTKYADETGNTEFVPFQGHDFSMRGMMGVEAACVSGAAHLLSFVGTDTIPAIPFLEKYYLANSDEELIGCSVPATEHSVMCCGGKDTEEETFLRLIEDLYPTGIVSIVSDTWDYWEVIGETLPRLKDKIMQRDGKVVIRPDSGNPVDIICGDNNSDTPLENKGTIEALWDIFGGTVNDKGYKELDPHIGVIYGDSITLDRAEDICRRLKEKGFASTNIVFGIGSYTYQHVTRDTFGFAMKATYAEINGEGVEIFKDPATDSGLKKSAKGLLRVNNDLSLTDCATWEEEDQGELVTVFEDGVVMNMVSLSEIRDALS